MGSVLCTGECMVSLGYVQFQFARYANRIVIQRDTWVCGLGQTPGCIGCPELAKGIETSGFRSQPV